MVPSQEVIIGMTHAEVYSSDGHRIDIPVRIPEHESAKEERSIRRQNCFP